MIARRGLAVADVVGEVEGAGRERDGLERAVVADENVLDAGVELDPERVRLNAALLAGDDLGKVRLGVESERRAGPVVEIRRALDEGGLGGGDEVEVGPGREDRVAQVRR